MARKKVIHELIIEGVEGEKITVLAQRLNVGQFREFNELDAGAEQEKYLLEHSFVGFRCDGEDIEADELDPEELMDVYNAWTDRFLGRMISEIEKQTPSASTSVTESPTPS